MVVSTGHLSRVSIELCGEVRLEVDGRRRERELPGRLGRVLLGYLALNRHRAVTRDELIEALWPKGAPGDPAGTLSTLLSGVRRCSAPSSCGPGELRLVLPADARLDVETAAARVGRSRARAPRTPGGRGGGRGALDVLERGLLRGVDVPWLDAAGASSRTSGSPRSSCWRGRGWPRGSARTGALAAAGGSSRSAPYRESGYALLMEAQAAQGNVAEALRTYERLRRLMRDELGAVPVARSCGRRTSDCSSDGGRAAAARHRCRRRSARAAARRFVGRAGVALLRRWLADRRPRRFVLLAGEPGIGKTSLAAAFAREAHERGDAVVLYGRSDEDALGAVPAVRGDARRTLSRAARRRRRALPAVRGRGRGVLAARPAAAAACWSATTCSGPTRRRCCCSATSRAPRRPSGCCRRHLSRRRGSPDAPLAA